MSMKSRTVINSDTKPNGSGYDFGHYSRHDCYYCGHHLHVLTVLALNNWINGHLDNTKD